MAAQLDARVTRLRTLIIWACHLATYHDRDGSREPGYTTGFSRPVWRGDIVTSDTFHWQKQITNIPGSRGWDTGSALEDRRWQLIS